MSIYKVNKPKPGWPQRILAILKLENPISRFLGVSILVVGGIYLIFSAFTGEFVEAHLMGSAESFKLLGAAALFFLALIFEYLVHLAKDPHIEIFANEYEAENRIKEIVADTRIETAKFLEYSAASPSVSSLLKSIINSDNAQTIKLLIHHPSKIHSHLGGGNAKDHGGYQVRRILSTLENLSNTTYQHEDDKVILRIRCYEHPASLRGRNLNEKYLILGWFTYDNKNIKLKNNQPGSQIWGAENAIILARGKDKHGGEDLKNMFNEVFDNIWRHAIPLKEAVQEHDHHIEPVWLEAVSRLEEPMERESMAAARQDRLREQNTTEESMEAESIASVKQYGRPEQEPHDREEKLESSLHRSGTEEMVDGQARVELDRDFAAAIKGKDYKVFLTPEGNSQGLYVYKKDANGFEVREQQEGTSNLSFNYQIVADYAVADHNAATTQYYRRRGS